MSLHLAQRNMVAERFLHAPHLQRMPACCVTKKRTCGASHSHGPALAVGWLRVAAASAPAAAGGGGEGGASGR
eukprot:4899124-Alexandrium_andersonii.AAC.1